MKLRIATYNIHKGVSTFRNRPRVFALKNAIADLQADIIFLQEVQGRNDLHALRYAAESASHWPQQSQHSFLASESHHVAYGVNAVYDHGHHGNALLSSLPILSMSNQDISDHAYEERGILHCVVQCPQSQLEIHCFVVHLRLFAGGRKRQADALIDAVKSCAPKPAPVIIAGDFNDWGDRLSDDMRAQIGVQEVFEQSIRGKGLAALVNRLRGRKMPVKPARTFPAAMPWLRLDRIYVRGFHVESAHVHHGPQWARLSDHAPIVASLVLSAPLLR